MFYIHQTYCISPQQTYPNADWNVLHESENNQLKLIEPAYENIPRNVLRRMGKSVRAAVGAALSILNTTKNIDGIITGTATAGKEDSFSFLKQVMEYNEGLLTPTNFVQSTSNAIASQIAILNHNTAYNITHVHEGLAFENAMLDGALLLQEHPQKQYLLGGVDELCDDDFNLNRLAGCYKKETISNLKLYTSNSAGTLAGEGAAMFLINNIKQNAIVKVDVIKTLFSTDKKEIQQATESILAIHDIDIFISGENGDQRIQQFYNTCESVLNKEISILRFKHLCGEYPTASAFALFLASDILATQNIPETTIKKLSTNNSFKKILIYNCFQEKQHSFIIVSKP